MSNDSLSSRAYLDQAKTAAKNLGRSGDLVTIEDVRGVVGAPPSHANPTLMGQVFRGKEWTKVGTVNATREGRRSSKISQFQYLGE
jgi:hypothetical protein